MCGTCGCGAKAETRILNLQTGKETALGDDHRHTHVHDGGMAHRHGHDHDHRHAHPHDHGDGHVHDHEHPHSHAHAHAHAHGHHHDHPHDDAELHGHAHSHDHDHHGHEHSHGHTAVVELEMQILAKNDALAASNRGWFAGREILALNLVSSPGSGKTTLLERTIGDLKDQMLISVIEGDQATANDGERIRAAGAAAIQVNTGAGCHLEADMLAKGLFELKPAFGSVVMIENVGNLVCPAMFDLGEHAKVVILSVTEGDDKPLKYPHMFRAAKVMIINKIDLLAHVDFDVDSATANARRINPEIVTLSVSAKTGEGLGGWYEWLHQEAAQVRL